MNLVVVIVVLVALFWLLGLGHILSFNLDLHVGGGLETLLIVALVVMLVTFALRRF